MIDIGKTAPAFTLYRDGGNKISLKDYKGSWVLLYFYPKDLTSGCTKQAIDFTTHAQAFAKLNTVIIGISPDNIEKHDKFIKTHNLNIILASDEKRTVLNKYDVWKEKKMYGRSYMGVERATFLIDHKGKINMIWRKVKVNGHAEMLLDYIEKQNLAPG